MKLLRRRDSYLFADKPTDPVGFEWADAGDDDLDPALVEWRRTRPPVDTPRQSFWCKNCPGTNAGCCAAKPSPPSVPEIGHDSDLSGMGDRRRPISRALATLTSRRTP